MLSFIDPAIVLSMFMLSFIDPAIVLSMFMLSFHCTVYVYVVILLYCLCLWVKRTGMQRRFGEIGSASLNPRKINKNCQHSNQITFSCHYMSVFSSLILSLPNFIVSVYSSTLPGSHCVTSHSPILFQYCSLRNRLDCKV